MSPNHCVSIEYIIIELAEINTQKHGRVQPTTMGRYGIYTVNDLLKSRRTNVIANRVPTAKVNNEKIK